jgi:hypothetical protein
MKMNLGILKLEDLVRLNGPLQILQLILQEQVDEFMEEEIIDADDYVDWLRWVSYADQSRQAMYESTQCAKIPILLQVDQIERGNLDRSSTEQLTSSNHHEMSTRWREFCQRIRVDTGLDKEKQQLWKVLECY